MKDVERRDFVKGVILGGAVVLLDTALNAPFLEAASIDVYEIGACRRKLLHASPK